MEKTFEELIKDFEKDIPNDDSYWESPDGVYYIEQLSKLLQQVREATIAECVEIMTNPNIPKSRMAALPTDRIKI